MKKLYVSILLLFGVISACTQKNKVMKEQLCDLETGICTPTKLTETITTSNTVSKGIEVIYVGDPMCSWCWGISKELTQLKKYHESNGGTFNIVLGGLRPGGGDPWNDEMKGFLKHHWKEVTDRSGQPFGYKIFDKEYFNYDTEPSCRAVVVSREFKPEKELNFFEAVQEKFYVKNEDPNEVVFYKSICEEFEIDYEQFKTKFSSKEAKDATHAEFVKNRNWGVKGYPTILLRTEKQLYEIANGYATFEEIKERIDSIK